MIARITTIMNTTPGFLWKEITKPRSLQYVAAPILYFFPTGDTDLNRDWEINREYNLALFFLKFIPLGAHKIIVKKIDVPANELVSNESGELAKVWNHTIQFNAINSHQIEYTDTIEIKAGWLKLFIWVFSHIFTATGKEDGNNYYLTRLNGRNLHGNHPSKLNSHFDPMY